MVEHKIPNYGDFCNPDFCKESKCIRYNLIERLKSTLKSSQIEKELEIARIHCKQNCERTAQDYYQWLKEKQMRQWFTQRS